MVEAVKRTTLRIRADVALLLKELKKELRASIYDGAIRALLDEHHRLRQGTFGRFKTLPPFKRDKLDRFE